MFAELLRGNSFGEEFPLKLPLRNLLMIFGTWELHSQAPKMTERFWESAVRNLFRRTNPTMHQIIYSGKSAFAVVYLLRSCGVLLKVLSSNLTLNSHYFFVIWVKDPNGEKALKVLGVGFCECSLTNKYVWYLRGVVSSEIFADIAILLFAFLPFLSVSCQWVSVCQA